MDNIEKYEPPAIRVTKIVFLSWRDGQEHIMFFQATQGQVALSCSKQLPLGVLLFGICHLANLAHECVPQSSCSHHTSQPAYSSRCHLWSLKLKVPVFSHIRVPLTEDSTLDFLPCLFHLETGSWLECLSPIYNGILGNQYSNHHYINISLISVFVH